MTATSSVASYLVHRYTEYWQKLGCSENLLKSLFAQHYPYLTDSQYRIPSSVLAQAYRRVSDELSEPLLGVKTGLFHIPGSLGVIGTLTSTSKDIKMALCCGIRFFDILSQAYQCTFHENHQGGTLRVFPLDSVDVSHHQVDAFLSTFVRLVLFVHGAPSGTIYVTHTPSQAIQDLYRQILNIDIHFGQDFNGYFFPSDILAGRLSYAGDEAHQQQLKIAFDLYEKTPGVSDMVELLRRHLHHAQEGDRASLEVLAEQLIVTPRTLQNQLKRQALSFSGVALQEKLSRVDKLVVENIALEEISKQLGYEHVSSFQRAFKSYKGKTFQEYYPNN